MEEKTCKFCNKKFPSGKSLGGHIRIHKNKYSGIRESPKKEEEEPFCCKECGKEFVSWKAMCGHMACHSVKVKVGMMDRESDTETSSVAPPPTRRRSKRKRLMKLSDCFSYGTTSSSSSSAASEIDQEQKDGAFCLMMMSRDSNFNKGSNFVADSSDNNSMSSSEEQLKIFNVMNQVLDTDKVVDNSSDSDMNGLKKSARSTEIGSGLKSSLNRFRSTKELGFRKNSLGGHKRLHSTGIEHEAAEMRYLIDLNLPAHPDIDE